MSHIRSLDYPSLPEWVRPDHRPEPRTGAPRVAIALAGEPAELAPCLYALARQRTPETLRLAPGSFAVVMATTPAGMAKHAFRPPFPLHVISPRRATADWAWRDAMLAAAASAGPGGIVLAAGAGVVPEAGWVAALATALAGGAQAVAGGPAPPRTGDHAAQYAEVLRAIAARLDPAADEPWLGVGDRDVTHLAVQASLLAEGIPAGGAPALLAMLRRRDIRIGHAPGAEVQGARPAAAPERLASLWHRLRARAVLRRLWENGIGSAAPESPELRRWAARLGLPAGALGQRLGVRHFGAAWADLQQECPTLRPHFLQASAIAGELLQARLRLGWLRLTQPQRGAGMAW